MGYLAACIKDIYRTCGRKVAGRKLDCPDERMSDLTEHLRKSMSMHNLRAHLHVKETERRFPSGRSSLKIAQRESSSSRRRESTGYVLAGIPDYVTWLERLYLKKDNGLPLQL